MLRLCLIATVTLPAVSVVVSVVFVFDTVLPVEKNSVSMSSSEAILRKKWLLAIQYPIIKNYSIIIPRNLLNVKGFSEKDQIGAILDVFCGLGGVKVGPDRKNVPVGSKIGLQGRFFGFLDPMRTFFRRFQRSNTLKT